MERHGNARLTPLGRTLMCWRFRDEGWTVVEAAEAAGCSERTCPRWLVRYDAGEVLTDRSSAPHQVPRRTAPETEALIEQLRHLRWTSTRIAAELGLATSTVCAVLRRQGLQRLCRLEPPEPANRYCRRHPGELIHIDIKKLGRFDRPGLPAHRRQGGYRATYRAGGDYVHVAVDDTSRLAYVEILDDEKGATCAGSLRRAIAWFSTHGVTVRRIMTDNGTGYRSKIHAHAVAALQIKHLRTRPYRPRTKALVSHCTSWGRLGHVSVGELAAHAFDVPRVAGCGRLVELFVLVVGLVRDEQASGVPALDGARVDVEAGCHLGEVEHPAGAEPVGVAG
jgi:transposase